jgi:crotonyl-CoA reductase
MEEILAAVQSGEATARDFEALPLPESFRAVTLHSDETEMFDGIPVADRDCARSMHSDVIGVPQLGPDEALIATMASAVNYNTVWSAIFEPVPTFRFLDRFARLSAAAAKHSLPYHVIGSDLAGVVLRVGSAVSRWRPGDRVVAHCLSVDLEHPDGHNDAMLDPQQRIWGYETNFGGFAELSLVKANQLMPMPAHLTWEEAACSGLVNSTAYRQLVSSNGAGMKQGDVVLIWGAAGGLGSYATQLALHGGAVPVCVVSTPERVDLCHQFGVEHVIDRVAEGYAFWRPDGTADEKEWRRFGARIRELTGGEDPDIVFEHPGRDTFAASVYVARRGGTVVTCASTTGYWHQFDNRYLWMSLKRVVGTHFANYREAWAANRLIGLGRVHPTLSCVYPLDQAAEATRSVQRNVHIGKVGVLCLSPRAGLGVADPARREELGGALQRFSAKASVSPS